MKTPCSKLYFTRAIKTQNRAEQKEASITLNGITLTDSLIRWSLNEWPSVCQGIPLCLPITSSEKLPERLISLLNEHLVLSSPKCNPTVTDTGEGTRRRTFLLSVSKESANCCKWLELLFAMENKFDAQTVYIKISLNICTVKWHALHGLMHGAKRALKVNIYDIRP
jgi:hypothetical protein